MKLRFIGLDHAIEIKGGEAAVLEVANKTLFSRICQSLMSGKGDNTIEPYSLWNDEGGELKLASVILAVTNPFALPWEDRRVVGRLFPRLNEELLEDNELREEIEMTFARLRALVTSMELSMHADYGFDIGWDLGRCLKSFGFKVEVQPDAPLIDNLIQYIDYASDMGFGGILLFVNLKNFLAKNDLLALYERIFFHKLHVLLLENSFDSDYYEYERKLTVDQHFLEY